MTPTIPSVQCESLERQLAPIRQSSPGWANTQYVCCWVPVLSPWQAPPIHHYVALRHSRLPGRLCHSVRVGISGSASGLCTRTQCENLRYRLSLLTDAIRRCISRTTQERPLYGNVHHIQACPYKQPLLSLSVSPFTHQRQHRAPHLQDWTLWPGPFLGATQTPFSECSSLRKPWMGSGVRPTRV